MKIIIKDKRYLASASKKIVKHAGDRRIIAFYGSMGAGKTTIIKSICKVLGAADITSSPTFTIVNEYRTVSNESLYHIDFYRITKSEEIFDTGIGEYLSGGFWCFLEWPELAEEILPPETVKVRITVGSGEQRILHLA
ncbi:MAG: tRNA (adenosine(37)-N6)-threonylcarbamoyltransferase complex ATPase subunit type 1 TsaE [Bacteroidales bacterium]|nr:tRNA (adenosine(37)-N6)-threonylcarbamoyltransferase complex ATPase subunit type 1 TsaE [Bacteroidales bacterium]